MRSLIPTRHYIRHYCYIPCVLLNVQNPLARGAGNCSGSHPLELAVPLSRCSFNILFVVNLIIRVHFTKSLTIFEKLLLLRTLLSLEGLNSI